MSQPTPRWRSWPVLAAIVAACGVLSWRVIGDHVARGFIGVDPSGNPIAPVVAVGAVIALVWLLVGLRLRQALLERRARRQSAGGRHAGCSSMQPISRDVKRRTG